MLSIALLSTLLATAVLIATAIALHIEASDHRRERAVARSRADYLRRRGI